MTIELMNPCGEFTHHEAPLSARPGIGAGTTVGLFCNSKQNADTLLDNVERRGSCAACTGGESSSRPPLPSTAPGPGACWKSTMDAF